MFIDNRDNAVELIFEHNDLTVIDENLCIFIDKLLCYCFKLIDFFVFKAFYCILIYVKRISKLSKWKQCHSCI